MTRERRNAPAQDPVRRRRRGGDRSELDLSDEELRALADEGIDPEDVQRVARDDHEQEASDHDRDTARDQVEGLTFEQEDDY